MSVDRRTLLQQALAAALVTSASGMSLAAGQAEDSGSSLLKRMSWLNPPASTRQSGAQLVVRSGGKTDFWRKTFYGYITDNGHFFGLPVEGDFLFQARVNGQYAALYDQAGIMVRLDERQWMKCG